MNRLGRAEVGQAEEVASFGEGEAGKAEELFTPHVGWGLVSGFGVE